VSNDSEPIGLNLMISWSSLDPDDLKLVDMRDSGVHLPVTARDLAWLLSVIRRINYATARKRRHSANERAETLERTWRQVRATEQEARRQRSRLAGERSRWARKWRGMMDGPA
jgi:hypothetical protein